MTTVGCIAWIDRLCSSTQGRKSLMDRKGTRSTNIIASVDV